MILNISFLLFLVYGGAGVTGQNFESGITFKKKNSSLSQSKDFLSQLSQNSKNVTLTGRYGLSNGYCYSVFVKDNIVYFGDGNYLEIADVSDPANPVELSKFTLSSPNINGICVSGNYAYLAYGKYGLAIIDVSDPAAPKEAGHFDTTDRAYGVFVSGNYAYVADSGAGLRIIDISDPTNPQEAGYYDTDGSSERVVLSGDYIYLADNTGGLLIFSFDESTSVEEGYSDGIAEAFKLYQNYPNPFNPSTAIEYRLLTSNKVKLAVYSSLGQTVRLLVEERQQAGVYTVHWDGRNSDGARAPSGIYIYHLKAGDTVQTRKMVLTK